MPTIKSQASANRLRLLSQIRRLAQVAIYGSLSETYRRCGNPGCGCHHGGPKHGPHLYLSYRGNTGKTTGYYVPQNAEAQIRHGVDAWSELQDRLRELAAFDSLRSRSHPGEALGSPGDCRNALYWLQRLAVSASPIRPPLDPSESVRLSSIDNTHCGKPPGPRNIP